MDVLEAMQKRFSCRTYLNKEVKDETLYKILEYANYAPSAGNLQTWRFIIVKDKNKKEGLAEACVKQDFMIDAPVLIVICGDEAHMQRFYKTKGSLYCIQECAAVTQNILLAATELGLVSCWIGAFDANMVKKTLDIPENMIQYSIVSIGYTNEKSSDKKTYDLNTKTYFNTYGSHIDDKNIFPLAKNIPKVEEKSKNSLNKIKNLFKKSK